MMRIGGQNRIPQSDANLANMSQAHLMALGQQGNASHEQLLEMQAAQQGMQELSKQNIEVPKVNFYPSRHPDPHKARKGKKARHSHCKKVTYAHEKGLV